VEGGAGDGGEEEGGTGKGGVGDGGAGKGDNWADAAGISIPRMTKTMALMIVNVIALLVASENDIS
jgi:hypothetical protein